VLPRIRLESLDRFLSLLEPEGAIVFSEMATLVQLTQVKKDASPGELEEEEEGDSNHDGDGDEENQDNDGGAEDDYNDDDDQYDDCALDGDDEDAPKFRRKDVESDGFHSSGDSLLSVIAHLADSSASPMTPVLPAPRSSKPPTPMIPLLTAALSSFNDDSPAFSSHFAAESPLSRPSVESNLSMIDDSDDAISEKNDHTSPLLSSLDLFSGSLLSISQSLSISSQSLL